MARMGGSGEETYGEGGASAIDGSSEISDIKE